MSGGDDSNRNLGSPCELPLRFGGGDRKPAMVPAFLGKYCWSGNLRNSCRCAAAPEGQLCTASLEKCRSLTLVGPRRDKPSMGFTDVCIGRLRAHLRSAVCSD